MIKFARDPVSIPSLLLYLVKYKSLYILMFVFRYQSLERIDTPTFKSIEKIRTGVGLWSLRCRILDGLGVEI